MQRVLPWRSPEAYSALSGRISDRRNSRDQIEQKVNADDHTVGSLSRFGGPMTVSNRLDGKSWGDNETVRAIAAGVQRSDKESGGGDLQPSRRAQNFRQFNCPDQQK